MKTRFILINTSHAGNVGAAARAMKTMGFDDLVLVAPRWANVLRREETIQRASGALDVLEKCRIVATLDEALDGMTHLCATAMIGRDFGPPTVTPREHFEMLSKRELLAHDLRAQTANLACNLDGAGESAGAVNGSQAVAFLFGCERFGMRNEDVYRCHVALSIPSNPRFGSLNLAAALQLIAYEWRLALGGFGAPAEPGTRTRAGRCTASGGLAGALGALAGGHRFSGPAGTQKTDATAEPAVQPGRSHAGRNSSAARHRQDDGQVSDPSSGLARRCAIGKRLDLHHVFTLTFRHSVHS
jgi:tRNA/rRNA methyltransferase